MSDAFAPGLIVAAPSSGSGKTTVTLGLLRALARKGERVSPLKAGPDYIDPGFHGLAARRPCANLDVWAMRSQTFDGIAATASADSDLIVCEGVMGLFDGATATAGSTADIAARTGWPVVLVVDASAQAASAAAVVRGFAGYRAGVTVAGVVFNRVASERHRRHIRDGMAAVGDVPIVGFLPGRDDLSVPSRHLGLVQAMELGDAEAMIEACADHVGEHLDIDGLIRLAARSGLAAGDDGGAPLSPLGQRIAVADDVAFGFRYPHVMAGWRSAGAELLPFSPLAGEGPAADADAVYLAGGYPELHAGGIAANAAFLGGLRDAAARGAAIFGECGGYMVLGEGLIDAEGARHAMAGLLPVETSFAARKLHLGYRRARLVVETPLGPAGDFLRGHEFHYASIVREDTSQPLFALEDAFGDALPPAGTVHGRVAGSFIHLIDRETT